MIFKYIIGLIVLLFIILSEQPGIIFVQSAAPKYPVFAIGPNNLLLGNTDIYRTPLEIKLKDNTLKSGESFLKVTSGYFHTAAIIGKENDEDYQRRVIGWGSNSKHQLMINKDDSEIYEPTELEIPTGNQIIDVDCSKDLTCFLLLKKTTGIYSMNCIGDLTHNKTWAIEVDKNDLANGERLIKIISSNHVTILGSEGTVLSSGDNSRGQFGNGVTGPFDNTKYTKFYKANTTSIEKVKDVSVGPLSTFYLTTAGNIYHSGALSSTFTDNNVLPKRLSKFSTNVFKFSVSDKFHPSTQNLNIAVISDDKKQLFDWKFNNDPELITNQLQDSTILDVHQAESNIIALVKVGDFYTVGTFGDNEYQQSNPSYLGKTPFLYVWNRSYFNNENIVGFTAGSNFMVVNSKNRIWAWGDNYYSQCGIKHPDPALNPKHVYDFFDPISSISSSRTGTVFITEKGEAYSYGVNSYNLLLQQYDVVVNKPKKISELPLNATVTVESASISLGHAFFSLSTGEVYGVGNNDIQCRMGQLPTTRNPIKLDFGRKISYVSNGFFHSLFLSPSNDVDAFDPVGTGIIFAVGDNTYNQLGEPSISKACNPVIVNFKEITFSEGEKIIGVNAGEFHSVAITSLQRVFIWGNINNGELIGTPKLVKLNLNPKESIEHLSSGAGFTIIYTTEKRLFGFGDNSYGNIDGLIKTDPKYKPFYTYEDPLDIREHFVKIGVLNSNEFIKDAAIALTAVGIITSRNRFIHFGDFFNEKDSNNMKFFTNSTIREVEHFCDKPSITGGSSIIYITCTDTPSTPMAKILILIMVSVFLLALSIVVLLVITFALIGIYQKLVVKEKSSSVPFIPLKDETKDDQNDLFDNFEE